MSYLPPLPRRWARLGLLIAALLHFTGAAAGPWVHIADAAGYALRDSERSGEPGQPAPHDERGCLVCHSFSQIPLPGTGSTLAHAPIIGAVVTGEAAAAYSPPARILFQARAPPSVGSGFRGLL